MAAEDGSFFRPTLEHLLLLVVLAGMYFLGTQNYLLFHSLVELFSVVVATSIFIIAWNTRSISVNPFVLVLGIAYLFVGGIDMVHMLAYKGMGVFPDAGANLPTQLWIAARYLQVVSILVAARAIGSSSYPRATFAAYTGITALLLASIFTWGVFPDCFVEGQGLTSFKVNSEYVICILLIVAVFELRKRRYAFEPTVYRLLVAAILITVVEELAFTLYSDPYGPANLAGHLLKLVSFYLIYKAIVETGLSRPYEILFRDMKISEERFKVMFDNAHDLISIADANGKVEWANPVWEQVLGYKPEMLENSAELIHPNDQANVRDAWRSWRMGESEITNLEYRLKTLRGNYVSLETTVRKLEVGGESYTFTIAHDITERTKSEQKVRDSEDKFRTIFENSNDIVLFVDTSGLVVDVNDRLKDLTGYEREDVIGRSFLKLGALRANDLPRLAMLFKKAIETGELDEFNDVDITCKDGSTITLEVGTRFVRKGDRIAGTVNILRDVSTRRKAEEEIRNLSRFPSENPNPVMRIAKDGTLLYANSASKALFKICGCKVGKRALCKRWYELTGKALKNDTSISEDFKYGERTYSFVFAPVSNADYVNVYVRDITERKKVEERYRTLVESASDLIFMIDQDLKVLSLNTAASMALGKKPEDVVGNTVGNLFPRESATEYSKNLNKVFATGVPLSAESIMIVQGRKSWINAALSPVKDEAGDTVAVMGVIRDITDRKQAEERFREFFENQPEYCYMVSPEGTVLDVNQAALEILGYKKEELVDKPLAILYAPESLERMKELLAEWNKSGILKDEEMVIKTKAGERRTVLLSANAIMDAKGNVLQSISVQRDITERKIIEKELHDFRKTLEHVVKERTTELEDAKNGLEFLSQTAMEFVGLDSNEDLWYHIGERLSELIGDGVVFVNSYDEETGNATCQTAVGFGKNARKVTKLLGHEPEGTLIPIAPDVKKELLTGKLMNVEGGVYELTCKALPKKISDQIDKLLDMGQMYGMGLVREGRLFGSVTFMLRRDNTLKDAELVETFVNQASVAVQRRLIEEDLQK